MASELQWGTSQVDTVQRQLKGLLSAQICQYRDQSQEVKFTFSTEPSTADWDVLHHLRRNYAAEIDDENGAMLQKVHPRNLQRCYQDLSGPLSTRLRAARTDLETLTGVPWTQHRASLSANIPPDQPPEVIGKLVRRGLISIERREPNRLYVVNASEKIMDNLLDTGYAPSEPDVKPRYEQPTAQAMPNFLAEVLSRWQPGMGKLPPASPPNG